MILKYRLDYTRPSDLWKPICIEETLGKREEKCQQSRKNNKNVGKKQLFGQATFHFNAGFADSRHYFEIKALKRGC